MIATSRTPQVVRFSTPETIKNMFQQIRMAQQIKHNALIWAATHVQHAEQDAINVDITPMRNIMRMRTHAEQCGYKTNVEEEMSIKL